MRKIGNWNIRVVMNNGNRQTDYMAMNEFKPSIKVDNGYFILI